MVEGKLAHSESRVARVENELYVFVSNWRLLTASVVS